MYLGDNGPNDWKYISRDEYERATAPVTNFLNSFTGNLTFSIGAPFWGGVWGGVLADGGDNIALHGGGGIANPGPGFSFTASRSPIQSGTYFVQGGCVGPCISTNTAEAGIGGGTNLELGIGVRGLNYGLDRVSTPFHLPDMEPGFRDIEERRQIERGTVHYPNGGFSVGGGWVPQGKIGVTPPPQVRDTTPPQR